MLALKEFATFVTHHKADLAQSFARLYLEQAADASESISDRHIALARRLLNGVIEACNSGTPELLLPLFERVSASEAHSQIDCLGQILVPVVTNLEAGKFLWQTLSETRSAIPSAEATLEVTPRRERESSKPFEYTFDKMPVIFLEWDVEGTITRWNDKATEIFGWSKAEAVGQTIFELFVPEDYHENVSNVVEYMKAGIGHKNVNENITKDGERLLIEWYNDCIQDDEAETVKITSMGFDITTWSSEQERPNLGTKPLNLDKIVQKQAEIIRNKSDEKYRTILESLEDGYYEVDLKGNLTFFNEALPQILGYPAAELMGMNNRAYADEENAKILFQTFNQVFATENPVKGLEWVAIGQDGRQRTVDTSVSLIKDDNNQPIGFRGIARDVTERKQTAARLKESEDRFRLFMDATPDPVVIYDDVGQVIYLNPAFSRTFGWSQEELLGQRIDFVPEENVAETKQALSQLFSTGRVMGFESKRFTKAGATLEVEVSGSVFRDEQGQPAGSVIFIHELTDRKRVEDRLTKSLQESKEQAKRLDLLNELGTALNQVTDSDELFKVVAAKTNQIMAGDRASVALLNPAGDALDVFALSGEAGLVPVGMTLPLAGTQTGQTVVDKRLLNAPDLSDGQYLEHGRLVEQGLHSSLTVPLTQGDQTIGSINVASSLIAAFGPDQESIMLQLASILSATLEKQQLLTQMQRRATQLEAVAQISTAASTILDVGELLNEGVNLIRNKFDFYYVGLFLVDVAGEWAVLQAGTGEAGRIQLERNHRLEIGGESMIGWSIENKEARIALDVGKDAVRFENPVLPNTHSEMALPLISRGNVMGALTVQSVEQGAFSPEDITILQAMADQLANAITNAQLFEQTNQRTLQLQTVAQISTAASTILAVNRLVDESVNLIRDRFGFYYVGLFLVDEVRAWAVLQAGTGEAGRIQLEQDHRLEIGGESMIGWSIENKEARIALDVGKDAVRFENPILPDTRSEMALPLISRGEAIGALTVQSVVQGAFSDEDITLLQAMADQLANAIANTRLFEQAQASLAETEQLYQISLQLSAASNYDEILQVMLTSRQQRGISNGYLYTLDLDQTGRPEWMEIKAGWLVEDQPLPFPVGFRFYLPEFPISDLWIDDPQEPLLLGDIEQDERVDENAREVFRTVGIQATVILPLRLGDRWIGLTNFAWVSPQTFTDVDKRLYQAIANQAALLMNNQLLIQETERRARRERVLYEVSTAMRQSLNPETIIKTGLSAIGQELSQSGITIHLTPSTNGKKLMGE